MQMVRNSTRSTCQGGYRHYNRARPGRQESAVIAHLSRTDVPRDLQMKKWTGGSSIKKLFNGERRVNCRLRIFTHLLRPNELLFEQVENEGRDNREIAP